MNDNEDKLADAIHQTWIRWCKYMLNNLTPGNIERWNKQITTSYTDLSDNEKESDRIIARHYLSLLEKLNEK